MKIIENPFFYISFALLIILSFVFYIYEKQVHYEKNMCIENYTQICSDKLTQYLSKCACLDNSMIYNLAYIKCNFLKYNDSDSIGNGFLFLEESKQNYSISLKCD